MATSMLIATNLFKYHFIAVHMSTTNYLFLTVFFAMVTPTIDCVNLFGFILHYHIKCVYLTFPLNNEECAVDYLGKRSQLSDMLSEVTIWSGSNVQWHAYIRRDTLPASLLQQNCNCWAYSRQVGVTHLNFVPRIIVEDY